MQNVDQDSMEQALAQTETDATAALKAAEAMAGHLRRFRSAARVGNLRELRSSIEGAEKALAVLRQQFANAKEGWIFDEEEYLADGRYVKEVLGVAERMGVRVSERDERLYSYPSLVRVSASDKAAFIDKKRENRIRPSVLVGILRDAQRKPPHLRPQQLQQFLNALHTTYLKAVAIRAKDPSQAPVIALVDLYELFTLLPGQAKEYTRQEFARDVYLLHRSGVDTARNGAKVSFPISRGAPGKILTLVDETGEEKRYYGICFIPTHEVH